MILLPPTTAPSLVIFAVSATVTNTSNDAACDTSGKTVNCSLPLAFGRTTFFVSATTSIISKSLYGTFLIVKNVFSPF